MCIKSVSFLTLVTLVTPLPVVVVAFGQQAEKTAAGPSVSSHPFDQRPQPWLRGAEPILSAHTTKQAWNRVVTYSPHVLAIDGKLKMWYIGTSTGSRAMDMVLGYAESTDGYHWQQYEGNPIMTAEDIPWGLFFQTPFVLYDSDEQIYKMWFSSTTKLVRCEKTGRMIGADRPLGYATSPDGIRWKVFPRVIYPASRSPSVIKEAPHRYRMWMNETLGAIYELTSNDGIHWNRGPQPSIRPSGKLHTAIYPFVLQENGRYFMWYGGHVDGGIFEIFAATSADGSSWKIDHQHPAFPASERPQLFDGRYTSTPCVVSLKDRYLLYYSARDWKNDYVDGQGKTRRDGSGVYATIGVAEIRKPAARVN